MLADSTYLRFQAVSTWSLSTLYRTHLNVPEGIRQGYFIAASSSLTFPLPFFPPRVFGTFLPTARISLMSARCIILSQSTTSCDPCPLISSADAVRYRNNCFVLYELSKGLRSARISNLSDANSSSLAPQRRSLPFCLESQAASTTNRLTALRGSSQYQILHFDPSTVDNGQGEV